MKLELSKQEWTWLYNHIGAGQDLGIGLVIYLRMKNTTNLLVEIAALHKEADAHQINMQEARQKALNLESQL